MSKLLKEPVYGPHALDNQWVNNIFQSHALYCGCNDPILHLFDILNKQGKARKPIKDLQNIKCLLTGETTTTEEEEEPFGDGDLEKLFSEDNDVGENQEDPTEKDSG